MKVWTNKYVYCEWIAGKPKHFWWVQHLFHLIIAFPTLLLSTISCLMFTTTNKSVNANPKTFDLTPLTTIVFSTPTKRCLLVTSKRVNNTQTFTWIDLTPFVLNITFPPTVDNNCIFSTTDWHWLYFHQWQSDVGCLLVLLRSVGDQPPAKKELIFFDCHRLAKERGRKIARLDKNELRMNRRSTIFWLLC